MRYRITTPGDPLYCGMVATVRILNGEGIANDEVETDARALAYFRRRPETYSVEPVEEPRRSSARGGKARPPRSGEEVMADGTDSD
ncbi:hypothetical protein [Streptomyces sp. URMC 129]|uniref:hypothetical protein n=1 Tax=Streptomyces sp. URMC 129 TaxID=3423407 RepID=UPI003F1D35EC